MSMGFNPVPKPSHGRRVRKRGERSKFSKMVRDQVKEHFENQCQECGGKGIHVHHVQPRSNSGRGVITNALLLCNGCHKHVHADNERLRYWKCVFRKKYGPLYFMDEEDLQRKFLLRELKEEDREVREWKRNNEKNLY